MILIIILICYFNHTLWLSHDSCLISIKYKIKKKWGSKQQNLIIIYLIHNIKIGVQCQKILLNIAKLNFIHLFINKKRR